MDKSILKIVKANIKVIGECYIWQGRTNNYGYPCLSIQGVQLAVHRIVFEHKHGDIPNDLTVDHKIEEGICTSKKCVRPSHLQLLTRSANSMKARGSTDTHFACGHPKKLASSSHRRCQWCINIRRRERRHAW